jgi:hypothetical protein
MKNFTTMQTACFSGMLVGNALGQLGGGGAGLVMGARYNPDIIDPKTGEKRKLNNIERAAAVLGGGAVGQIGGGWAGTAGGAAIDGARYLASGKPVFATTVETTTDTVPRIFSRR